MKSPSVAIIGAGPVGLFSAFTCGMRGYRSYIFDKQKELGGQCVLYPDKPIYDIPGFKSILGGELIENLKNQVSPFNPIYRINRLVLDIKKIKDGFELTDSTGAITNVSAVIISAGIGAFTPKKPKIPNIENYENNAVLYHVLNKEIFKDKEVAIAGGGDSACDWVIELSNIAKKVHVIHRRDVYRCHPSTLQTIKNLSKNNVIEMHVPYKMTSVIGDEKFRGIALQNIRDKSQKNINCDFLLPFFGLESNIEPVKKWGLVITNNTIDVDYSTMMTNVCGIFAIGDIANYKGKLKLIMNGFAESAICSYALDRYINPNKVIRFEHSTTSGVKPL